MFRLINFVTFFLVAGGLFQSVYAVQRATQDKDIIAVIANESDLSLIASQLANNSSDIKERLEGKGPFTVFAAVNNAFFSYDPTLLAQLQKPEYAKHLEKLLLNHLTNGSLVTTDLGAGDHVLTMLSGENITLTVTEQGNATVSFPGNGTTVVVNVTTPNLIASDGVVHKVDGILLPKFVFTPLASLAPQIKELSKLTELLTAAFPTGLPPGGNYTIFAPHNDVFDALGDAVLENLKMNQTKLIALLTNHVYNGILPSTMLVDGGNVTPLGMKTINVTRNGDAIMLNDANVIIPDILALNGIVHVIDKILFLESSNNTSPGSSTSAPVSVTAPTPATTSPPETAPTPNLPSETAPAPTPPAAVTSSAPSLFFVLPLVLSMGIAVVF